MELSPRLAQKLAILTAVTGVIALAGCGENNIHTAPQNMDVYDYNLFIYPREAGNRVEATCKGTSLVIKTILTYTRDRKNTWEGDPACRDRVLSREDNIATELTTATGIKK